MNPNDKISENYSSIGDTKAKEKTKEGLVKQNLLPTLPKNLNLYWLSTTGLAVWFLLIHTPPYLTKTHEWGDLIIWFHLVGVVGIYLACIFNTLVTPSWNRPLHVIVGRVGLVLGVWGFGWGAWLSWGRPGVPLSFSIPITFGGILQLISEAVGYYAIRKYKTLRSEIESLSTSESPNVIATMKKKQKRYLMTHIACMVALFVNACSTPALIRLAEPGGLPVLLAGIGGLILLNFLYNISFFRRLQDKSSSTVDSEAVSEKSQLIN